MSDHDTFVAIVTAAIRDAFRLDWFTLHGRAPVARQLAWPPR